MWNPDEKDKKIKFKNTLVGELPDDLASVGTENRQKEVALPRIELGLERFFAETTVLIL